MFFIKIFAKVQKKYLFKEFSLSYHFGVLLNRLPYGQSQKQL
jgi:hypothetical protein